METQQDHWAAYRTEKGNLLYAVCYHRQKTVIKCAVCRRRSIIYQVGPQGVIACPKCNQPSRGRNLRWVWEFAPIMKVHAPDEATALNAVIRSEPRRIMVISCAPCIGFEVEDEKKVVLSA